MHSAQHFNGCLAGKTNNPLANSMLLGLSSGRLNAIDQQFYPEHYIFSGHC